MAVTVQVDEGVAYLKVDGDLDLASTDEVREAGLELLNQNIVMLMLDLTDLGFMDSAGLAALLSLRNQAVDSGKLLQIDKVNPQTQRLLELTGLADWFVIRPDD